MAEDSDLEKTEEASGRKLEQARERGNVPRSRELASLAVLLMSAGVISFLGVFMFQGLQRVMHNGLRFGLADVASPAMMGRDLMQASLDGLVLFLPLALGVVIAAVAANLMISGWVFSPKALEADFSKLNPFPGISRMFSRQALVELFKALMKGGLIAGVAGWMIWHQRESILTLSAEPLEAAAGHFAQIILFTFLAAAVAFSFIVALDVPFQIWNYHHGLRMSKEEVRQEAKETEGDPQIKARIRALQRETARRRMMQAVPKADVVVTNPLHFAVALKYDENAMAAPVVLAKGAQLVAERIKQLARENRVPIVAAPPLARALHRHVEVGAAIPATLFTAVAQVLAYVYQVQRQMQPTLPEDWQVPAKLDPAARTEVA
ncbi:MAG: flagellar biosynthetic protein FlhB [Hydrogenophilales bacterium CG17_big_fil_post_rev_8_21_14_2_50_63_12]|nr:MAG: flagellar biosynthetic protein FlhB [Hydrogenophilales bacterium CG17_big_fil_post_rev_8_21_14_2_50_63_12]PIX96162.1 MAG: flagellar biosynthetic protein FlhB [Hydrogenophilales bacterium CG_4_10_14_3_um_filter_63_21]PJB04577.1 MAG: flagellar biosynthetic protein FlhB [Hydrogenophilales bacterium CG_4_9_14_3_um_filter_63_34]